MNLWNLWIKLKYAFDTVFLIFFIKTEKSAIKSIKLRARINFIISSSDISLKVPDRYVLSRVWT